VPETPYVKFRLGPDTLDALSALAASSGNLTQAVRESAAYWHAETVAAARLNADELTRDEWHLLAHTGTPSLDIDDEDGGRYPDWSQVLALELVGVWEGRPVLLASHAADKKASHALAKKVAKLGPVRGYAIMSALRWFWGHQDTADAWWHPEVWMTPEVRPGKEV
jgi:hypothetical protein